MAAKDIWFELVGDIAGLPMPKAKTLTNEALANIYDEQMWTFQFKESGWLTPGLLFSSGTQSQGTITATAYSDQIVGDATAAALWAAYASMPLFTQLQIRVPYYSLYNIIAFDGVNTITVDRPWMEPSGAGQAYMIYQAYFAAPGTDDKDFKRFFAILDPTNSARLNFWKFNRTDLAVIDPQRTNFNLPAYVAPYETDARPNSATLGYMLYELWPHPLSSLPYSISYLRRGPLLTLPADTVPVPLVDEFVRWRAKEVAYLWKESQKGDGIKRGEGADWRFLASAAAVEYKKKSHIIAARDSDMAAIYWQRFVRDADIGFGGPFATQNMGLNVGRF